MIQFVTGVLTGTASALLVQFSVRLIFEPIRAFHVERVKLSTWLNVYKVFYNDGPMQEIGRSKEAIADGLIKAADDLQNTYALIPTAVRASGIQRIPKQQALTEAVRQTMVLALVRPKEAIMHPFESDILARKYSIQANSREDVVRALLQLDEIGK